MKVYTPTKEQAEFHELDSKRKGIYGPRASGKTTALLAEVFKLAIAGNIERVAFISRTRALSEYAMSDFQKMCSFACLASVSKMMCEVGGKVRVFFFHQDQELRGLRFDVMAFDEVDPAVAISSLEKRTGVLLVSSSEADSTFGAEWVKL